MKNLFTALFLLAAFTVYSQATKPDKIIRRDKKVLEVIIQEVGLNGDISYKKFSSPKGATLKVPAKEVASIEYANGYVDEFPEEVAPPQRPLITSTPTSRDPQPNTNKQPSGESEVAKTETKKETKTEPTTSTSKASTSTNTATDSKTTKSEARKTGSTKGVELSAKVVTGLDFERVAMEELQADVRSANEYAGEYQWRRSNTGVLEVGYKIDWDNVSLVPKEWIGYGYRRGPSERDVKLKGNKLMVSGKTVGSFVKFDANGKEVRGLVVEAKDGKDLFLWKVK
jgi:hypothetical protein